MSEEGLRLLLLLIALIVGGVFYSIYSRNRYEQELLKSQEYADAVKDWEEIQAWFVREPRPWFKPFPLLLDTGGFAALEILVTKDEDGKLKIPLGLTASEFILAVSIIKGRFRNVEQYGELF